jgi:hypothetical protein
VKSSFVFLLFCILCVTTSGFAQAKVEEKKGEKGNAPETGKESQPAPAQLGWSPEIGALGTVALPIGDAGTILNMGFGGKLDFNTHIPALKFLKQGGFEIRPGIFAGVQTHSVKSSTKTGSFLGIPAVVYAEVDLTNISKVLTPYVALGGGVTMASATSTTTSTGESAKVSSVDATLYGALGAKYYFGAEKRVFVKAEAAFYMIFEEVSGMFVQGNVGAGYRL